MSNNESSYIENEIPQIEMKATATSYDSLDPPSAAIDGNINTMWHTPWNKSAILPQSLIIDLGKSRKVSTIKVTPRIDGIENGIITRYKIYSINNEEETLISEGVWAADTNIKIIHFDKSILANSIKITAIEGKREFASIAEVNIYELVNIANPVLSKRNIRVIDDGGIQDVSDELTNLKDLQQGTIIIRFRWSGNSTETLLGISKSNTNNDYFWIYLDVNKIGFRVKYRIHESSTSKLTTSLIRHKVNVKFNAGFNTLALKIEKNKGYTIFLNGLIVEHFKDNNTKFLNDIKDLNSLFIGKLNRKSENKYVFRGDIDYLCIYSFPLSDNYLFKETLKTIRPNDDDFLPQGVYKSIPINLFNKKYLNSNNYRIPALYTTKKGTILASIDARISHGGDSPNNIDTAIRRKEEGKDWEEAKIILNFPATASTIDTSIIQDEKTDRIFILVTHFPCGYGFPNAKRGTGYKEVNGIKYLVLNDNLYNEFTVREEGKVYDRNDKVTEYTVDADRNLYKSNIKVDNILTTTSPLRVLGTSYLVLIYSDDDGKTWSNIKDLNSQVKEEWMKFMGTGPGRGLQIKNGKYSGRIVFPIYYTNRFNFQSSALIYSDDNGVTWNRSKSPNDSGNGHYITSDIITTGNQLTEAQVVEMPNGQLKMFMRNTGAYVRIATSFDGGLTWSGGVEEDINLVEPYCQLSVINYTKKIDDSAALIFSNPNSNNRANGTVKIGLINENGSYKNGEPIYGLNWKYSKVVEPKFYAYSCLTELTDGNIGLFYEGTDYNEMSYIEMNLKYIKYDAMEQAEAAKIKSIKLLEERAYLPGETIVLKFEFNQAVCLMGNKLLRILIGTTEIKLSLKDTTSLLEFEFQGVLPKKLLEGEYNLKVKSNKKLDIYNIYGKKLVLLNDIDLNIKLNVKKQK